ncbi:RsiV family protein [Frederiksenia canicola]|uniref:Uncharacterized protein DUF4163 n=1 Tax=Frederiksenia canicola TaxID=123824 RepID=A0AAE7C192_9PAST|nr:RsiV family protein [Frederiksenia canicola]QIM64066.1 hypothetical protein A4G17_00685 [Frederiksenia canicola]RPE93596.1 uncharacterized protein DUF4163 [Frederiksenia canicola]
MKKSLIAAVLSLFVLTACDDQVSQRLLEAEKRIVQLEADYKRSQESLKTKETELAQVKSTFPALQVEIVTLFDKQETIKFEKAEKAEYQPEQSVVSVFASQAKTGVEWLDQILLKQLILGYLEPEKDKSLEKSENVTEADALAVFEKVYSNSKEDAQEYKGFGYENTAETRYVGQRNNIVTFTQFFYTYSGGAHGLGYTDYLNIDVKKQALIQLDDLIRPTKHNELLELLWRAYEAKTRELYGKNEETFVKKADFFAPNNFYFTPYGINFVYAPYAIGAYAEGEIELFLYFDELKEIVTEAYQPSKQDGMGLYSDPF